MAEGLERGEAGSGPRAHDDDRRVAGDGPSYRLVDMRSTCGTYLNGDAIPAPDDLGGVSEEDCARPLRSGDFFSLGPSAVNLFLFFQK